MRHTKILAAAAAAAIAAQVLPVMAAGVRENEPPREKQAAVEGAKLINVAEPGSMPIYEWDSNLNATDSDGDLSLYAALPSEYRSEYVTDVKNQGKDGCCWAFASLGAVEANVNKKGFEKDPDYSEEHLIYFAANSLSERYGDGKTGVANPYGSGGNSRIVADALSVWSGVETEKRFPYQDGLKEANERVYDERDRFNSFAHLKNYSTYTYDEIDAVKQAIIDYGAATYEFYTGDPEQTAEYYYNPDSTKEVDHEVLLVGWDDSVSKENFSPAPEHDGAWLARNSWGEQWRNDGYFWISYDNRSKGIVISVFDMDAADNYDNIRLYDGAGYSATLFVKEYANTFTAQKDEAVEAAAGFVPTGGDITAYVYKCSGDDLNFYAENGLLPVQMSQTKTVERQGYYTIDFAAPVNVKAGETYTIVMEFSGGKVCIEDKNYVEPDKDPGDTSEIRYRVNPKESYIKPEGGEWTDVTELGLIESESGIIDPGNVSVRALTADGLTDNGYNYDISSLYSLIETAKTLNKSDYDTASWRDLGDALSWAEVYYSSLADAESDTVEFYASNLHSALKALKSGTYTRDIVVKTANDYEKALTENYTPSSLAEMKAAIAYAKALPEQPADFELDAAMSKLVDAKLALKKALYITTPEELQALDGQNLVDDNTEAVLMNNIVFDKTKQKNFTPINDFHGTLDGNGHIISGMNVYGEDQGVGLFGTMEADAVVKNIGITNSSVISGFSVTLEQTQGQMIQGFLGGIAGICGGQILNSYVDVDFGVTGSTDTVQFVSGYFASMMNGGVIDNCYVARTESVNSMPVAGGMGLMSSSYLYVPEYDMWAKYSLEYNDETGLVDMDYQYCYYVGAAELAKLLNLNRGDGRAWFVNESGFPAMAPETDGLYTKDGVLYTYSDHGSTVTVPSDIKYIAEGAFENEPQLLTIAFAGDAPQVERRAFNNSTAVITYEEDAAGFDKLPWRNMEERVQRPIIQYSMSASKATSTKYNVEITPLMASPDQASFINAAYDKDGRYISREVQALDSGNLWNGVYKISTEIASNAVNSKFMVWTGERAPVCESQKIK